MEPGAQAFVESSGPGHEVTTFAAKVTGLFLSARQGDVKSGHRHVKDAIRQVPLPRAWRPSKRGLSASQALVLLSDHAAAHRLLAEARLQTSRLREPGSLVEKIEQAQRAIDAAFAASPVADPLTPAEMRVLRYLPTYMSFEEIGRDLVVSRTTVKTQAIAVYRKLGVRSRAEAVRKARQQGLLIA